MERLKTAAILALLAMLAGSVVWAATGGEAEVRITARQLEDGRVEFALQQRVDGEWGERMLPASRFFPADVGHNRWLNSTPLTVSVSEAPAALPSTPAGVEPVGARGNLSWGLWWVDEDQFTDARQSWISTFGRESNSTLYDPSLALLCDSDGLWAWISDLPISDLDDRYTVTERWGTSVSRASTYPTFGSDDDAMRLPSSVLNDIAQHDTVLFRINGWLSSVTVRFDTADTRSAPNWPEIANCGN